VTLVESTGKKARFLEHAVALLGLEGVTIDTRRAETIGRADSHRESYDIAVARAVADLAVLAEYMLPLVGVGGRALALKGAGVEAEVAGAEHAVTLLGGAISAVEPYTLPGIQETRHLVIIEKVEATPERYPRRVGAPAKRPLRN
jgi:16S rRNA (guanine527-N7)-methyltransferase